MDSKSPTLCPVSETDEDFLHRLYATTRAAEMELVPWSEHQKKVFLRMQSEAQTQHYRERYPHANFDLIKLDQQPIGRLYVAELEDEIRIIDLAFLPDYYDRDFYVSMLEKVMLQAALRNKSVRIHLEYNDAQAEIFVAAGFQKIGVNGLYFLWERKPSARNSRADKK